MLWSGVSDSLLVICTAAQDASGSVAAIITRPPETIMIACITPPQGQDGEDATSADVTEVQPQWIIFDSHRRPAHAGATFSALHSLGD